MSVYLKYLQSIIIILILMTSCSDEAKTDSELLERDKKELAENLDSYKVATYKFGKILLRAGASNDTTSVELNSFKAKFGKIADKLLKYDLENPENLSVIEYVSLYRDYKKMEKFIIETDEDTFPTLTEAYVKTKENSAGVNNQILLFGEAKEFTQNIEHAILSAVVVLSKDLGKEISLYECSKTKPDLLPDSEIKTILQYFRGFLFFEKDLYYLSEDEISRNIDWLNKNKDVDLKYTRAMFKWGNLDNKQTHTGFHALNHLFRGFDRLMMDRKIDEKHALEDFEMFLKDTKEIGLDNEIVWSIETYLYLKNEENEKAIASLTKLKTSNLLSSGDKKQIDESIEYVENRESGKVLNGVYDKYFLSKIATKYMFAILSKIDWEKILKDQGVPHTDEMFKTMDQFNSFVNKLNKYSSTDMLKEAGEEINNQGKSIWDKAKGIIE